MKMKKGFVIPTVLLLVVLFGMTVSATLLHNPQDINSMIEDFSFSQIANEMLYINLTANNNLTGSCHCTLYAVIMNGNKIEKQEELLTVEVNAGNHSAFPLELNKLGSYDHYRLMLGISSEDGETDLSDALFAEGEFSYYDGVLPGKMTNIRINIGSEDGFSMDWGEDSVNCDGYQVSLYNWFSNDPIATYQYDSSTESVEFTVDHSVERVRSELRYRIGNKFSEPAIRMIDRTMLWHLSVRSDTENSSQAKIVYDFEDYGSAAGTLTLNGKTEQLTLEGKGSYPFELDWFDNEVTVTWAPVKDETLTYTVSASIYNDRTEPSLTLDDFTAQTPVLTKRDQFLLRGSTNEGSAVTVNGEPAELDEDNTFCITVELKEGTNEFTVVAQNKKGIETEQTAVIIRYALNAADEEPQDENHLLKYWPYAAGGALLILFIVLIILIIKSGKTKKEPAPQQIYTAPTVICPYCGVTVEADQRFCPNCGKPLQ